MPKHATPAAAIAAAAIVVSAYAVAAPAVAKPACDGRAATIVIDDVDDLTWSRGEYVVHGTAGSDIVVLSLSNIGDHVTVRVLFDGVKGRSGGNDALCATAASGGWVTTLAVEGGDVVNASGWEVFKATNPTSSAIAYAVSATRIDMTLGGGDDEVTATSYAGHCRCQQYAYIDGGAGDDWIYLNVIDGSTDAMTGVFGGDGDDTMFVHGRGTKALTVGGAGSDTIQSANATLLAYTGAPTYAGTAGGVAVRDQRSALNALLKATTAQLDAVIKANPASDRSTNRIFGGSGADILHGSNGADQLSGGSGNDRIRGEAGADTLSGGAGGDRIEGGDDNDLIEGGDGSDWLRGNGHNDHLIGGKGTDDCSGGPGTDVLESCNP